MNTWQLSYKGDRRSLADWGIFNAQRHVLNQGSDTLTFQTEASHTAFQCNETIEIFKNETRWFSGRITQTPMVYTATNEAMLYKASGPAWYLEHLVYQQPWEYLQENGSGTISINRSVCILGQDEKGNAINAQQCLANIIAYAKAHGAPLACGPIEGFDFTFPCETIQDCSCNEAIIKILRWTPDAIVWFDYTTPTPTVHIARANALATTALSLKQLSQFSLTPRHDLQVSAVVLKYEHSHNVSGTHWKTITLDREPSNATGEEMNALVLTVELEGSHAHVQEQWVKTEPITVDDLDWWKKHFPCLAHANDIKISNIHRQQALPYELIEGAVAPWMGCKSAYETITAELSYTTPQASVGNRIFAIKICSTDAQSKTYRKIISTHIGNSPPTGLAATLYKAMACLQHEGEIRLEYPELPTPFIGRSLSFTGGNPEWEQLKLPVQEEHLCIDTGTIRIKCGAPKHLGRNDMSQLMRNNRTRNITEDTNIRFAKKRSGDTRTYFPHLTPITNTLTDGGKYNYKKLTIEDQSKNTKITLDTHPLPKDTEIAPKEYYIVENGALKKVWIPSSQSFT